MSFNERYPFLYAIIETSASNVASLIDRGADVNTSDSLSRTALMYSVKHDRESILCLLIDRGADVNICDTLGRTALMYSVIHDRESIAALLIDRGADINTCDTLGRTALMYGVIHNRENIVAVLIDKNADVSTSDSLGRTALVYGVIHNRECMVALVIDKNADVSMSDSEGITALMHGVIHNRESMVALLIDCDADVNTSDSEGRTALIYSVMYNRKIMIDLLIDGGADINTCDSLGRTALMYGVIHNRKIMVDLLIDRGADVNTCDSLGRTALIYSVIHDRESIVASLIDRGADVNTSDSQGRTALIYGVMLDRESIVCLLIDRVAGVNTSDSEGITALMYGVILDRESIVALLIDGGADVNTSDNEGITALMYGVIHNSDSKVALLIDRGSDVNTSDSQGRTALMYGVIDNRESTVALLIARGADVNLTDNEGKTALFYGVSDENIVRALIEQGNADIDKKDQYGRSSLFYAFTKYPFKSARYLIGKGSDLQLKDNGNLSILSFYVEHCIDVHPFLKVNPNICTELNVFQEHGEKQKAIFEALINLMLCTTLKLKCGFYSWNILTDTALNLAKKYVSSTNLKKKKIIQNILKISNKNEGLTNKNYQRILELLFKLGANPCYADSDGNTVLHYATCLPIADVSQDIVMKICHQLKGLGVTFNAKNHQNETPLLYCLSNKKWITSIQNSHKIKILVDVCKFLLAHGASVEGTTRSEKSIFHFLLELFQQGLLLSECATRKDVLSELLKLLELFSSPKVAIGVAVNRRDINLNSPLHMWASLRFELTLDNDGSDDQNRFEKELLKKVLRHLMDCGAQLDDKNRNGETPLHLCRTWTAVKLLIEAGAQPNVVDSVGRTPLLVASKNIKSKDAELFYSDVQEEPKAFWKTAIESNLDPWTVDKNGESVLSVLIKLQAFVLTKALIELACEENYIQSDTIAVSLLSAICRDRATRTQWKSILVEEILKSRKFPIRYENNKDTPLHFCCKNITRMKKEFFSNLEEIQNTSVHWAIAKHLLVYGADCNVRDASDQSCLDIAESCPALKDLLTKPLNLDEVALVFPWTSISMRYNHILAKVARRQECKFVGSFWFHQDKIEEGSFGLVFAGLNEKDGREVAIKRMEKLKRPEADKKEVSNLTLLADCEQVVTYLSFSEDEHFSYIILELMEGNLDDYLSSAFDVNRSITLCGDVVKGLKYLHEQNILHRDLKPTNILFKTYPKLCFKIADFGLSRQIVSTSTTTSGSIAGTRCWIAPEVLKIPNQKHSMASDVFSCGLVLHYVLSVKRHPFSPVDHAKKSKLQVSHETEANLRNNNPEGWDNSLCPEATDLVKGMLNSDDSKRRKAAEAIAHPLFWSEKKKMDLLIAVGNQPEFQCKRGKRTSPLTEVEKDLDKGFRSKVTHATWNDPAYTHMPFIYKEMETWRKYDTKSVVELVRFIRNSHEHVSDDKRPVLFRKLVLKDFVFLEYFPKLVMEVFNCVKTHGWDTREEIKYVLD